MNVREMPSKYEALFHLIEAISTNTRKEYMCNQSQRSIKTISQQAHRVWYTLNSHHSRNTKRTTAVNDNAPGTIPPSAQLPSFICFVRESRVTWCVFVFFFFNFTTFSPSLKCN